MSAESGFVESVSSSASSGSSKSSRTTVGDLPPSSYDGSHLPWKTFRQQVLAPHRIRIVESAPKERLPAPLLAMIEAEKETCRFDTQKTSFREQVSVGRGFGPSPIFPPNLLPSIDDESFLARCMIPTFSREALPERALNRMVPLYELSVPRPSLGCGFSTTALTLDEVSIIPSYLVTTGTIVHYDTGYIAPGAASYCPFLTFERTYGNKEHRLEAAHNQCAIAGAWCLRSLQLLYTKAWKGEMVPELPVAFSCALDNTLAIINFHWIDHGQAYSSSPLCKFDLSNDDHFTKFLVWIECIGKWAIQNLLPVVKQALKRIKDNEHKESAPATPRHNKLTLTTDICPDELLIRSLKTTFEHIPWRFEDDEFTPVSSSTASWGSPLVTNANFAFVTVTSPNGSASALKLSKQRHLQLPTIGQQPTVKPPASVPGAELALQKRLDHAMDEIQVLQRQLAHQKKETSVANTRLTKEVSGLRTALSSMLRKETLYNTLTNRAASAGALEMWSHFQQKDSAPIAPKLSRLSEIRLPPPSPPLPRADKRTTSAGDGAAESNASTAVSGKQYISTTCANHSAAEGRTETPLPTPPPSAALTSTVANQPSSTTDKAMRTTTFQIQLPMPGTPGLPLVSPAFSIVSNDPYMVVPPPPPPPPSLYQSPLPWKISTVGLSCLLLPSLFPLPQTLTVTLSLGMSLLRIAAVACLLDLCVLAFNGASSLRSSNTCGKTLGAGWVLKMLQS